MLKFDQKQELGEIKFDPKKQDLCEMEREGSGAEWGSRLARAQVLFSIFESPFLI